MEKISKERMGEIALLILKSDAKKDRMPDAENLKRNLGNKSKDLNVPVEELLSFWISIYSEVFEELISRAEAVTFEKIRQQPSPLGKIGDKIKGFVSFKKTNEQT